MFRYLTRETTCWFKVLQNRYLTHCACKKWSVFNIRVVGNDSRYRNRQTYFFIFILYFFYIDQYGFHLNLAHRKSRPSLFTLPRSVSGITNWYLWTCNRNQFICASLSISKPYLITDKGTLDCQTSTRQYPTSCNEHVQYWISIDMLIVLYSSERIFPVTR